METIMKKSFILSMALVWALCSCDSDPAVAPNPEAVLDLTLAEIDKSNSILIDAYKGISETASKEAILYVRKNANDKAEFMTLMHAKTSEAFEKAVIKAHGQEAAAAYIKFDGVDGESTEKAKELLLLDNATDAYKDLVLKRLKDKSAGTDQWFVMKELKLQNGASHDVPTEQISLNFEKIKNAIELADLLLDLGMSDTQRTTALGEGFDVAQVPPIPVALLLPAVQKVREAAKAQEAEELYLQWLDTEVTPTTSGGLDRDLIRRKAFFEYLGGLDLIIGQEFNNDNQLGASIAIMKARYDLKLLCLWEAYYDMELIEE
jgi:hypothetical protein